MLIGTAIRGIGHEPASLRRLPLTHFHADHAGSAAEIAAWGNVEVGAHQADAPFLRGEAPGQAPTALPQLVAGQPLALDRQCVLVEIEPGACIAFLRHQRRIGPLDGHDWESYRPAMALTSGSRVGDRR